MTLKSKLFNYKEHITDPDILVEEIQDVLDFDYFTDICNKLDLIVNEQIITSAEHYLKIDHISLVIPKSFFFLFCIVPVLDYILQSYMQIPNLENSRKNITYISRPKYSRINSSKYIPPVSNKLYNLMEFYVYPFPIVCLNYQIQ